jgi:hypothetical protein
MQTNNSINGGQVLPLLMTFTNPTPIEDYTPEVFNYDDENQISYEMRIIGTRCLRSSSTGTRRARGMSMDHKTDRKNEIDDSKSVR